MCHESPSAQFMGCMVTILGDFFMIWHLWRYDEFKCLKFTKRSAFRFIIVWKFIISMLLFTAWNVIIVYVKYSEYYAVVPINEHETEIMPVPFKLWDQTKQDLVRASYHILAVAWAIVFAIHSEETLYWAYLIRAIKNRDPRSWFKSPWFKVWLLTLVVVFSVLPAVAQIETTNLIKMEANIFMAGSILAILLFGISLWLYFAFPNFIKESRHQGANPDVLMRLEYFRELNAVRTVFRLLYVICILTLSIDGFTPHKRINTSHFWLDLFYVCALTFVFTSNGLSLMILLPRNLASEAGLPKPSNVFVRQPRPRAASRHAMQVLPSSTTVGDGSVHKYNAGDESDSPSEDLYGRGDRDVEMDRKGTNPWGALGERLNIDKTRMEGMDEVESREGSAIALGDTGLRRQRTADSSTSREMMSPFAPMGGERVLRPGERLNEAPHALSNFRSPADLAQVPPPRDINIVVSTDTFVKKH